MVLAARDFCILGESAVIVEGLTMLRERSAKIPSAGFNAVLVLSNSLSAASLRKGALEV